MHIVTPTCRLVPLLFDQICHVRHHRSGKNDADDVDGGRCRIETSKSHRPPVALRRSDAHRSRTISPEPSIHAATSGERAAAASRGEISR